jgi:formylglycine-generating enzyme required for sulfatase activity
VSGGEVTISILSDPNDPYSEKVKDTQRKWVKTFHIARYPITVAQYRAFLVAEDGWCDPAWWEDNLYRDSDGNTYEFGRFGNHPAVYVSWFDAVAFCRWLSRRMGVTVRLPDEWEWQQAATGGDANNVFPWGPEWDVTEEPWRANTFESRLEQATAVGMYPAGVAPTGVMDLAGTVWEWCLPDASKADDIRSPVNNCDTPVLRGGSWYSALRLTRAAIRTRSGPSRRSNDIGFRVVRSSPSSGR